MFMMKKLVFIIGLLTAGQGYCDDAQLEIARVKCVYKNLLTGKLVRHWGVTTTNEFLEVEGIKNKDFFETSANEKLMDQYCSYSNRVYHEDNSVLYKNVLVVAHATDNSFLKIKHMNEEQYPDGLAEDWFETAVVAEKINLNRWKNITIKGIAAIGMISGSSYYVSSVGAESANRFLTILGLIPFMWSTIDLIFDQEIEKDSLKDIVEESKDFLESYRDLATKNS